MVFVRKLLGLQCVNYHAIYTEFTRVCFNNSPPSVKVTKVIVRELSRLRCINYHRCCRVYCFNFFPRVKVTMMSCCRVVRNTLLGKQYHFFSQVKVIMMLYVRRVQTPYFVIVDNHQSGWMEKTERPKTR